MGAILVVPTVPIILVAVAANTAILEMGPCTAGGAGTEGVKCCKIYSTPHSIAGLFVTQPDGNFLKHFTVYNTIFAHFQDTWMSMKPEGGG